MESVSASVFGTQKDRLAVSAFNMMIPGWVRFKVEAAIFVGRYELHCLLIKGVIIRKTSTGENT